MINKDKKIAIRPYNEADYQYIHDLHMLNMKYFVDKYWGGWDSAVFKKDVLPGITWIVEYKGQKAGFFVLNLQQKAHLRNIQIHPAFQNLGLGRHVIKHCEQRSVRKGFHILYLDVFLDNRAKKLYEWLGYRTYKTTDSHYLMKKDLKKDLL